MALYYRRKTDRGYVMEEQAVPQAQPEPIPIGLGPLLEDAPTATCLECGRRFRTQKAVAKHVAKSHPTLRSGGTGGSDGAGGQ